MSTPHTLESLTVLSTTTCCGDGRCGCGCGLSLVQLSPPQADERPPTGKGRAGDGVRGGGKEKEPTVVMITKSARVNQLTRLLRMAKDQCSQPGKESFFFFLCVTVENGARTPPHLSALLRVLGMPYWHTHGILVLFAFQLIEGGGQNVRQHLPYRHLIGMCHTGEPLHQGVAFAQMIQCIVQLWPGGFGSAHLLLVDSLAARLAQGIEL